MLVNRYARVLSLVLLCTAVSTFAEDARVERVESLRATLSDVLTSRETLLRIVHELRPLLPEAATDEPLRSALVNTLLVAASNRERSPHVISVLEQLAVIARPSDPAVVGTALIYSNAFENLAPPFGIAAIRLLRTLLLQNTGVFDARMEEQLRRVSRTDSDDRIRLAAFEVLTDTNRLRPEDLMLLRVALNEIFDRMQSSRINLQSLERNLLIAQEAVQLVLRHRLVLDRPLVLRALAYLCQTHPYPVEAVRSLYQRALTRDADAEIAALERQHRAFFHAVAAARLLQCEERVAAQ